MRFPWLLVLFIGIPLLEIQLLLQLNDAIGWLDTLAVVIATGILGAALARAQGLRVIQAIRTELAAGRAPTPQILDGVLVFLAGVLLITPGLLTDTVGFLLLIPATRRWLRQRVLRRIERAFMNGPTRFQVWRG